MADSLETKVLSELEMTEADLENGVAHIREWLTKQPHLPVNPTDTEIKAFIIGSKSVERAKQKLDAYYSSRGKHFILENRDPMKLEWNNLWFSLHLPGLTPEGWKVLLYAMTPKNVRTSFDCDQSCQLMSMQLDRLIRDEYMSSGHILIVDAGNFSSDLFKDISVISMGSVLSLYQNVYPIRLKGVVFFNCSSLFEPIINTLIKPLISKKLKDKFFVYSDMSNLSKHIPIDMLPSDYGGKGSSWDDIKSSNIEALKKEKEWFMTKGSEKSDEDLRPPSDSKEFGVQGTFRKLNID